MGVVCKVGIRVIKANVAKRFTFLCPVRPLPVRGTALNSQAFFHTGVLEVHGAGDALQGPPRLVSELKGVGGIGLRADIRAVRV